jgi:hypothetical protein
VANKKPYRAKWKGRAWSTQQQLWGQHGRR